MNYTVKKNNLLGNNEILLTSEKHSCPKMFVYFNGRYVGLVEKIVTCKSVKYELTEDGKDFNLFLTAE